VKKNPVELVERWNQSNLILKIRDLLGSTVVPPLHNAVEPELPSSGSSTNNCRVVGRRWNRKFPMKSAAWLSGSTVPPGPPLFHLPTRFIAGLYVRIGWQSRT
jgi:hypothetical protein